MRECVVVYREGVRITMWGITEVEAFYSEAGNLLAQISPSPPGSWPSLAGMQATVTARDRHSRFAVSRKTHHMPPGSRWHRRRGLTTKTDPKES